MLRPLLRKAAWICSRTRCPISCDFRGVSWLLSITWWRCWGFEMRSSPKGLFARTGLHAEVVRYWWEEMDCLAWCVLRSLFERAFSCGGWRLIFKVILTFWSRTFYGHVSIFWLGWQSFGRIATFDACVSSLSLESVIWLCTCSVRLVFGRNLRRLSCFAVWVVRLRRLY